MGRALSKRDAAGRAEKDLNDALRDTFPSSGPIAFTPQRAGKNAHHMDEAPRSAVGEWWRQISTRIGARDRH